MSHKKTTGTKKRSVKKKLIKVLVKDDAKSLMQCGGGSYCNESK